ncbi:MAG: hypothetical protein AAB884_01865 [Patescibacteria group bacterium]
MSNQSPITFVKESFLISRAAELHELTIPAESRKHSDYPEFDTKPVGTFKLDRDFIATLQKHGFTFGPGTKPPHNEMVYLAGHSNQRGAEVFESDCWAWKRTETDFQLDIRFRLRVSEGKRGVVCEPHVFGNCSGGALHQPTIDNFVKAVVAHFSNLHVLIMTAANVETPPVIHWSEIGLGGIRSVGSLFDELCGRNEKVMELACSTSLSPFDPVPYPQGTMWEVKDRLFVLETDQPKLFRQWRKQLQTFKHSFIQL